MALQTNGAKCNVIYITFPIKKTVKRQICKFFRSDLQLQMNKQKVVYDKIYFQIYGYPFFALTCRIDFVTYHKPGKGCSKMSLYKKKCTSNGVSSNP